MPAAQLSDLTKSATGFLAQSRVVVLKLLRSPRRYIGIPRLGRPSQRANAVVIGRPSRYGSIRIARRVRCDRSDLSEPRVYRSRPFDGEACLIV